MNLLDRCGFKELFTTDSIDFARHLLQEFLAKLAFAGLLPDLVTVNLALAAFAAAQRPVRRCVRSSVGLVAQMAAVKAGCST